METANAFMVSNIVMLVILALLVVAGLAVSLIAIALSNIRSVEGKAPQQPADVERKLKVKLPRQRTESSEPSTPPEPAELSAPEPREAPEPSRPHRRLLRSGR